jgi:uncharacterized Zn finger protein
MNESDSQSKPTSTRCRYCGNDENGVDLATLRERQHYQVVVACGSCGHAFAAISRN